MVWQIKPLPSLKGAITIPGDKSISHRAVIFAALAQGQTKIRGLLASEDCLQTIKAFCQMGVTVEKNSAGEYLIDGAGQKGLQPPDQIIDCGNSGTTMRLMTGLLAAQSFYTVLTGDNSLRQRPMDRVIIPLREMGAEIWARKDNFAPLSIRGKGLKGIDYRLPVASAQVKSAILLAGLYTEDGVSLYEPCATRDHTERMLQAFNLEIRSNGKQGWLTLAGNSLELLQGRALDIPGDISSAAYFLAGALLTPDSSLRLVNVGINPSRSGILTVITAMGGDFSLLNQREKNCEPVADIIVNSSKLQGTVIKGELIPRLIDEIPIIAVMASQAEGQTIIKDAAELKVKESNRIKAVVTELSKMGVEIEELPDGMIINGPTRLKGGMVLNSYGDHRIAMSLAIAGLLADQEIGIRGSESIKTSFPDFQNILGEIRGGL